MEGKKKKTESDFLFCFFYKRSQIIHGCLRGKGVWIACLVCNLRREGCFFVQASLLCVFSFAFN